MEKGTVIITAGGIGTRMGAAIPKQFLCIQNKPVLIWCLETFHRVLPEYKLIVTLPESENENWKRLCVQHGCDIHHEVVTGGKERFDSVKAALQQAVGEKVLIHDGVRPLVDDALIHSVVQQITDDAGVIPVVSPVDSLRKGTFENSQSVARSSFHCVQTPQGFPLNKLVAAYEVDYIDSFTDDASVFEYSNGKVLLVEGHRMNLKMTHPMDLKIAEIYLQHMQ